MRIYSSKQRYEFPLDRYIGKDVWVLVVVHNLKYSYVAWARILSYRATDDCYIANMLSFKWFNEDSETFEFMGDSNDVEYILSSPAAFYRGNLTLCSPLEIMTSEELFGDAYENIQ